MDVTLDCVTTVKNIGASSCRKLPQELESFIKTPLDFVATAEQVATESFWQDAIKAGIASRIYLFPLAHDFENNSEEPNRVTSALGKEVTTRPGQYRFRFLFRENLEQHKAFQSHLQSAGRVWLRDTEKKLIATSSDGTNFRGFLLDQFFPEKLTLGAPSLSPIYMTLADNYELDRFGYQFDFSALQLTLKALTTVRLSIVGEPSGTSVVVSVKSALDNVPIKGLVDGDFVETMGGTPGSFTETGDGLYTLTGSDMTTGTINLVSASSLSISAYESEGPVTATIS